MVISLFEKLKKTFYIFFGWIVLFPISKLFKAKKGRIAIIGRNNGEFTDNVKYFTIEVSNQKNPVDYAFITQHSDVAKKLEQSGYSVLKYPSIKSIKYLLSTQVMVADSWDWVKNLRVFLLCKASRIQLWHGTPIKSINLIDRKNYSPYLRLKFIFLNLIGRDHKFEAVTSPSQFVSNHIYSKAFNAKSLPVTGYPRNDILFEKNEKNIEKYLIESDIEAHKKILKSKEEGLKVVVYLPTFRDAGGDPITSGDINCQKLEKFAKEKKILFVFKFHTAAFTTGKQKEVDASKEYEHILFYKNTLDIYPSLNLTDMLITDYSSVFFDYLLLDKPIVFYPYDYADYIKKSRKLLFDYNEITPGDKAYNQQSLQEAILKNLDEKNDKWKKRRKEIKKDMFEHHDNKSFKRVWKEIEKTYIK